MRCRVASWTARPATYNYEKSHWNSKRLLPKPDMSSQEIDVAGPADWVIVQALSSFEALEAAETGGKWSNVSMW
jgi:hypothetical protein